MAARDDPNLRPGGLEGSFPNATKEGGAQDITIAAKPKLPNVVRRLINAFLEQVRFLGSE